MSVSVLNVLEVERNEERAERKIMRREEKGERRRGDKGKLISFFFFF